MEIQKVLRVCGALRYQVFDCIMFFKVVCMRCMHSPALFCAEGQRVAEAGMETPGLWHEGDVQRDLHQGSGQAAAALCSQAQA